ncbi:hypothetical protein LXL04_006181 [Taraxacum kok-saghyz]
MIGEIASGPMADFFGCKGAPRISTAFCTSGWLARYFAQLMICTGVSVAFIIGTVLTWRILALTGLIHCVFLLVGLFFVPESPRWLVRVDLYAHAFVAATFLDPFALLLGAVCLGEGLDCRILIYLRSYDIVLSLTFSVEPNSKQLFSITNVTIFKENV